MKYKLEQVKAFKAENSLVDGIMTDWVQENCQLYLPIELKYAANVDNSKAIISYVDNPNKIRLLNTQGFDVSTQAFKEIYVSAAEEKDILDKTTIEDIFQERFDTWRTANVDKYIMRLEFSIAEDFYGCLIMYMEAPNKEHLRLK